MRTYRYTNATTSTVLELYCTTSVSQSQMKNLLRPSRPSKQAHHAFRPFHPGVFGPTHHLDCLHNTVILPKHQPLLRKATRLHQTQGPQHLVRPDPELPDHFAFIASTIAQHHRTYHTSRMLPLLLLSPRVGYPVATIILPGNRIIHCLFSRFFKFKKVVNMYYPERTVLSNIISCAATCFLLSSIVPRSNLKAYCLRIRTTPVSLSHIRTLLALSSLDLPH